MRPIYTLHDRFEKKIKDMGFVMQSFRFRKDVQVKVRFLLRFSNQRKINRKEIFGYDITY